MKLSKKISFYSRSLNIYLHYKFKNYKPFLVVLILTKKCNLNCKYCTENKKQASNPLTKEEWLSVIDDLHTLGVPLLSFSGGEPLLHPHLLEIARYAKKKGFMLNLNTNGTLITKRNAKEIVNSFDTIRVSLNGIGSLHDEISGISGTYKKVVRGISCLTSQKKGKTKMGINFVVTKTNEKHAKELAKDFKNKVGFITFLPQFSFIQDCYIKPKKLSHEVKSVQRHLHADMKSGNTPAFINNVSLKFSKQNCDAGKLYFQIFPGGGVSICPFYTKRFGFLKKHSIIQIYKKIKKEKNVKCNGCYATCTTEVSRVFRKNPVSLIKEFPKLTKTFKI